MGDRRHIIIKQEENEPLLYFYTHWRGYALPQIVQSALVRGRSRWDDETYLASIIFLEMVKGNVNALEGAGISTYFCESEYSDVEIDCPAQTVKIGSKEWSFEDYCTAKVG